MVRNDALLSQNELPVQIGILSDTHGYFHPRLPEYLREVDLILHAGDVGRAEILDGLEALAPTRAVWGNVDGKEIRQRGQEHQRFQEEGLDFWMTHIAGRPGRWQKGMGQRLKEDTPDIFVCGHSHILRIERVTELGDMLFINPGAAGREGFHQEKTCVRITLEDGRATQAEVIHLDE